MGHGDSSAIYFLNPGTAMNHSDSSREASVIYSHEEKDVLELWTVKDIKAGEEMFNAYHVDSGPCAWYDEHHRSRGNIPISQLNDEIEAVQERLRKKRLAVSLPPRSDSFLLKHSTNVISHP